MNNQTEKNSAGPSHPVWNDEALDLALERQQMEVEMDRFLSTLLPLLDGVHKLCRDIDGRPLAWVEQRIEALALLADLADEAAEQIGLRRTAEPGEMIDTARHEAVAVSPGNAAPRGAILEVEQHGWMFRNRVLRQARVVVSSGPDATSTGGANG